MPVATQAPVQVVPIAPAIDASSEGAVAPASKKARQYDLQPQQPLQPMPHLQPRLPTSSSSPAALQEPTTTSSPTEPETKKHKQQHEEDEPDQAMDSFHPLQPAARVRCNSVPMSVVLLIISAMHFATPDMLPQSKNKL